MHIDRDRLKTGLLLVGVVGFATLGQYYLLYRREYVWDGVIFIIIALVCFALLTRAPTAPLAVPPSQWLRQRRIGARSLTIGLALLLNWIAARSANATPPPDSYSTSVALWLTSLVLFFVPFLNWDLARRILHRRPNQIRAKLRQSKTELVLISTLLLAGLLLRAWDLENIPANFSGDEGTQGLWAVDALEGRLRNPFATGWFTVPTMSFFAQAASLRLFGDSVAGLRALSALTGTATLVFTYLLIRRNFRLRVALFALAALTFNHFHIHFSRLGSNQIADPLFTALTLWLLTEGLRRTRGDSSLPLWGAAEWERKKREDRREERRDTQYAIRNTHPWFLAAGLTTGLSWYGYFGSRVMVLIVATYLGTRAMTERGFLRRHALALTLMVLTALMVASPLLLYYTKHSESLSARWNQVNFFRWLEDELARPDHDSTLSLVLRQVWLSISAFNHTLDPTFWYRAQIPLLDFVSGILFVLGLAVAIGQWRRPAIRLVLIWFGLALTFGWILTENPPSSMRMVIIAPVVALLVALGLDRLLSLARQTVGGRRTEWTQVGLLIMAVVAVLNVRYYFMVYTPTRVYGNPTAETCTVLARYLAGRSTLREHPEPDFGELSRAVEGELAEVRDDQLFVYFYGPPFMYYDFGAIRFIARDVPGVSVPPRDQEPDYSTRILGPTLFVVLRERLGELAAIQDRHPYGRSHEFYSEADGRLMFVVYEVLP
jgi:4-amino-4-deoxy-L-arabinose transferase-like glycosyltransferase